jgi:hypothetical protein
MSYLQLGTIKLEIKTQGCLRRKLRQPFAFNRPQRTANSPRKDHKNTMSAHLEDLRASHSPGNPRPRRTLRQIQDECTRDLLFEVVILNEVKDPCISSLFFLPCGRGTPTLILL